jgi:hypothetical protein
MSEVPPVNPADTVGQPTSNGDAAAFQAAVAQAIIGAMASIGNTIVGDTIEALNEPFGDPDQQPF